VVIIWCWFPAGDLTGTRVMLSTPAHVYSGNIRTDIPETLNSRDHLVEELLPFEAWGTEFGIVPLPDRMVGDRIRVVSAGVPVSFVLYQVSLLLFCIPNLSDIFKNWSTESLTQHFPGCVMEKIALWVGVVHLPSD